MTSAASSDSIQRYETEFASNNLLWVVFYRGHWCPFCISYLKTLQTLLPSIANAGGKVLIVTAEPEIHLAATRKASGYVGEAISDPENKLAGYLKEKKLLDVAISNKGGYEHGMAQPAVLILKGKGSGEVLFDWAIVPSAMNLGGAKDRPDLNQIWDNVQAKLEGKSAVHAKYNTTTILGTLWGKVFG